MHVKVTPTEAHLDFFFLGFDFVLGSNFAREAGLQTCSLKVRLHG